MLRPALLLPLLGFRSGRLLTPRCGLRPLGRRLGPATGRSGAYPDGTLTRRLGGARTCLLRTSFRTRHSPSLYPALPTFNGRSALRTSTQLSSASAPCRILRTTFRARETRIIVRRGDPSISAPLARNTCPPACAATNASCPDGDTQTSNATFCSASVLAAYS